MNGKKHKIRVYRVSFARRVWYTVYIQACTGGMDMKRKPSMAGVVYLALLAAIGGYFFRMAQLSGGSVVPVIAFCALLTIFFLLAAVSLQPAAAFAELYHPSNADLILSVVGALALMAGCALSFRGGMAQMFVSLLGLLGGAGLAWAAVMRRQWKKPSAACYVIAVLFYVVKLFLDFRHWMLDPTIIDYCFSLLAMISFMLASYHAGAFSFDKGKRRRLAFFALTGVLFGGASLAGAQTAALLIYGGSTLWMLACAQQALHG